MERTDRKIKEADFKIIESKPDVMPLQEPHPLGKRNALALLYEKMERIKIGGYALLSGDYVRKWGNKRSSLAAKIRKDLRDRQVGMRWYMADNDPRTGSKLGDMVVIRLEPPAKTGKKISSPKV